MSWCYVNISHVVSAGSSHRNEINKKKNEQKSFDFIQIVALNNNNDNVNKMQ